MEHKESDHRSLKHFIPLLSLPLAFGMLRRMAFHRHMFRHGMGMHARENWQNGVPPFFAEWHRRAHEAEGQSPAPEVKESCAYEKERLARTCGPISLLNDLLCFPKVD